MKNRILFFMVFLLRIVSTRSFRTVKGKFGWQLGMALISSMVIHFIIIKAVRKKELYFPIIEYQELRKISMGISGRCVIMEKCFALTLLWNAFNLLNYLKNTLYIA